jgi:hypothetical protein
MERNVTFLTVEILGLSRIVFEAFFLCDVCASAFVVLFVVDNAMPF